MTYNVLMGTLKPYSLTQCRSSNGRSAVEMPSNGSRTLQAEMYSHDVCMCVCACVCVALFVGGGAESSPAAGEPMPTGVRSVSAPVYDPSQHQTEQAQYMTCKVCGALIT